MGEFRKHSSRYSSDTGAQQITAQSTRDKRPVSQRRMTYDEYVKQLKNAEHLFEFDDETKWTRFKEFVVAYLKWLGYNLRRTMRRLGGWARPRLIGLYQKQPLHRATITQAYDRLSDKFGQQNVIFGGTSVLVLILVASVLGLTNIGGGNKPIDTEGQVQAVVDGEEQVEVTPPTFDVVEPDDLSEDQRVLFNPELGVATYYDDIEGTEVIISQQPLTDEMKADREGTLEQIDAQMTSTTSFQSKFGTVYVTQPTGAEGTDPAQVAFFTTDELLVFIRNNNAPIRLDLLIVYINNID